MTNKVLHSRITKPLLYEQVIQKLLEIISRGEIKPGQKFPPERELVTKWQISRNVLREAFHVLTERGITVSIQGKGRFLRKLPGANVPTGNIVKDLEQSSINEIYEVRKVLECYAIESATKNASDEDIQGVEALFKKLLAKYKRTLKTDDEFNMHLAYAGISGNYLVEQLISLTMRLINEFMSDSFDEVLASQLEKIEDFERDNKLIIKYLKERNADKATRIMREHLTRSANQIKNWEDGGKPGKHA